MGHLGAKRVVQLAVENASIGLTWKKTLPTLTHVCECLYNDFISIELISIDYMQLERSSGGYEYYYMDRGILLAAKTLVKSIRHYIRDPSGVLSVCHACEWYIDKFPPFLLLFLFSKWPTSSGFVELSEDDIYHFCEQ